MVSSLFWKVPQKQKYDRTNKILFENPVLTAFYQKQLVTITHINKNIAKAQPSLRGPVEANQPRYYTSISMITRKKV